MATVYVFGIREPQHPDYAPAYYTCLCLMGERDDAEVAAILAGKRAGEEIFVHDGHTVGRDSFPVSPSPELAAAMQRAGWAKCHAPLPEERAEAEKHGVAVA